MQYAEDQPACRGQNNDKVSPLFKIEPQHVTETVDGSITHLFCETERRRKERNPHIINIDSKSMATLAAVLWSRDRNQNLSVSLEPGGGNSGT